MIDSEYEPSEVEKNFLDNVFLKEKYIMRPEIKEKINFVAKRLSQEFSEVFVGICVVGGLTNGSNVLRNLTKDSKPKKIFSKYLSSKVIYGDIDFYLIVDKLEDNKKLEDMANLVANEFWKLKIPVDGYLNGKKEKNLFDLSKIDYYINNERYDLIKHVFEYCMGPRVETAKKIVIEHIKKKNNKRKIWEEVQFSHDSTLGLHHSSFNIDFVNYVNKYYYHKRLEKFGLKTI